MKITELVAVIRANVSGFEAGMRTAISGTEQFRTKFMSAARDVETSASRIATVVGGMALGMTAATAKIGFSFLAASENAEVMLTTLLKSSTQAKQTLSDLLKLSKDTPFSFDGIRAASIQLINAKVSAENLIPTMRKLADSVASIGGTDEDLKGVSMALSQMMTSGKLNAGDMMQLTGRGIAAWDMLAQHMGMTVAQVRKLAESGEIDGREAAQIIIDQMGVQAEGASATMSTKFSGLWSSLADGAAQTAGEIFQPLFVAASTVMTNINAGLGGGELTGIVGQLRSSVADIADALLGLATSSGPGIIRGLADGFIFLADASANVIVYLQEQGPALMAAAGGWLALLQPIMQFLAAHPQLVVALLALKGGSMLGINQAVMSVTSALFSGVSALYTFATGASAAASAAGGASTAISGVATAGMLLKGVGLAALVIGIGFAAKAAIMEFSGLNAEIKRVNEQAKELDDELAARRGRGRDDGKAAVSKAETPEEKRAILQSQLDAAEMNSTGLNSQVKGAEKNLAARGGLDAYNPFGGADRAESNKELSDVKARAKEARNEVRDLKAQLAALGPSSEEVATQAATPAAQSAAAAKAGAQAVKDQSKIESKLQQGMNDDQGQQLKGFDKLRDFIGMAGVTGDQAGQFAGTMKGVTPEQAAEFASEFARSEKSPADMDALATWFLTKIQAGNDKTERVKDATKGELGVADTMQKAENILPTEQLNSFSGAFAMLKQNFIDGTITEDQYRAAMQNGEQMVRAAIQTQEQLNNAAERGGEKMVDMERGIMSVLGPAADFNDVGLGGMQDRFAALADQVTNGSISIDEFNNEMEGMANETKRATEAEKQKRLIAGDFAGAGLNFEDAKQKKMAQMQEGKFNQQVDAAAKQAMGLGNAIDGVTGKFGQLGGRMQQFGDQMQKQASPEQIGKLTQQLLQTFNSVEGQIALTYNNISMLEQALSVVDTYQQKQAIMEQIASYQAELDKLMNPIAPILTASEPLPGDDPGLQRGKSGPTINFDFPNLTRVSQSDADMITTRIMDELDRRGGSYR